MNKYAIDYYDHPLFQPYELLIDTPSKIQLKEILNKWLWTGITGGVIKGESRCGKTTAMIKLSEECQTRGGVNIPSHYFTVPDRDRPTINALYRSLSVCADLRIARHHPVESMLSNLINFFLEKLVESKAKHFVLLVDEGQRLSFAQYNVFAELHDLMRERFKILFTVIFIVNSDESIAILEKITERQYKHIHGRFFKHITEFYGIRNEKEVKRCLHQYDILRYPINGPTYTEFFLPSAVKKGWRYSSLSGLIWSTFREYQKNYRLQSWGMESFICTANILLYDFLPTYGESECNHEMVKAAIETSGLIPSLVKLCD
jgi:hypothetical protein